MEVTVTVTYLNGTIAAYRDVTDIGQFDPDVLVIESMHEHFSIPLGNVLHWKAQIA